MATIDGNKKKLTVSGEAIESAVNSKHEHSNSAVLDKLSDNNGTLQYNGADITGGSASEITASKVKMADNTTVEDNISQLKEDLGDAKNTKVTVILGALQGGTGKIVSSTTRVSCTEFYKLEIGDKLIFDSSLTWFYVKYSAPNENSFVTSKGFYGTELTITENGYYRFMFRDASNSDADLTDRVDNINNNNLISIKYVTQAYGIAKTLAETTKEIKEKLSSNVITVKKDGTGDFTKIIDAVNSITDSSYDNKYTIKVYKGEYDVYEELGGAEWLTTITSGALNGIVLPDYVDLEFVDDDTLIKMIIPDDTDSTLLENCYRVSPLNAWRNNNFKNVKIKAYNTRYCLHNESNGAFANYKQKFDNCYFEHLGGTLTNWTSYEALGSGSSSNAHFEYNNCKFISKKYGGFYLHTNALNTDKTVCIMNNCEFIGNMGVNNNSVDNFACRFQNLEKTDYGSYAIMNNCKINGKLVTTGTFPFKIYGSGNTECLIYTNSNSDIQFADETEKCLNKTGETIPTLTPIKMFNGTISKIASGEEYLLYGVTCEDIADGEYGLVKKKGYMRIDSLNIAVGGNKKLGIVDGAIARVTSGEKFYNVDNWSMKFIK